MRQLFVTWTIVLYLMVVFCSTGHSQTTPFYFIYSNLGSFYIIDSTTQLTIPLHTPTQLYHKCDTHFWEKWFKQVLCFILHYMESPWYCLLASRWKFLFSDCTAHDYTQSNPHLTTCVTHPSESKGLYISHCSLWRAPIPRLLVGGSLVLSMSMTALHVPLAHCAV